MKFFRTPNYNNSECRRQFVDAGIHAWAVRDEDAATFQCEYPECVEIQPEGFVVAIDFAAMNQFVTSDCPNHNHPPRPFRFNPAKHAVKIESAVDEFSRWDSSCIGDSINVISNPFQVFITQEYNTHRFQFTWEENSRA